MTVKDILGKEWFDIAKLSEKELKGYNRVLSGAARKRIKRIESSDVKYSPAVEKFRTEKQNMSGQNMSGRRKEISEFYVLRKFLIQKTSTLRGARSFLEKNIKNYGLTKDEYMGLTTDEKKEFWKDFHRLQEYMTTKGTPYLKNGENFAILRLYRENRGEMTGAELYDEVNRLYKEDYKQRQIAEYEKDRNNR